MYNESYEQLTGKVVSWDGWFEQFGDRNPMSFRNLQVGLNGQIQGEGGDAVGEFTLRGNIDQRGCVRFIKQYIGQHAVNYQGVLTNAKINGGWTIPNTVPGTFEISMKLEEWEGNFTVNGQKYSFSFMLNMDSQGIFGIQKDQHGAMVLRGFYNESDYSVTFTKQYIGGKSTLFQGQMGNNGQFWVIKGTWNILQGGQGNGEFELYREAPADQQYTPYTPPPVQQNVPPPNMYHQGGYYGQGYQQQGYGQGYGQGYQQQQGYGQGYQQQGYGQGYEQQQQPPQQLEGFFEDYELMDGETEDVNKVLDMARRGKKMRGTQLISFVHDIVNEQDLIRFAHEIGPFLDEFETEHLVQTCKECDHPDQRILLVEKLFMYVQDSPGAILKASLTNTMPSTEERQRCKQMLGEDA